MVIEFMNKSIHALLCKGFDVYPVIFDAKHKHCSAEKIKIMDSIKDVMIIENNFNIFPNKNFGVAAISKYAEICGAEFLAIVDPDWSVSNYDIFLRNLIDSIDEDRMEIVIPDIGNEAGRDNLLVGKIAVSLFYPEYANIIKTVFPGMVIGLTNKISEICLSEEYHFDWGGEWDIFSDAVKKGVRIGSTPVVVKNIRHRKSTSKMLDAYQMWRAVFCDEDFIKRCANMNLFKNQPEIKDPFSSTLVINSFSVREQIDFISRNAQSETQRQLLYMVLYPLAFIFGEMQFMPDVNQINEIPYEKNEIGYMSDLATHCFKSAIINSSLSAEEIHERANTMTNNDWSAWSKASQRIALAEIGRQWEYMV